MQSEFIRAIRKAFIAFVRHGHRSRLSTNGRLKMPMTPKRIAICA